MNTTKVPPSLKNERQNTDESLVDERDKTNQSLKEAQGKAERQTDKEIQGERIEADQATLSSRSEVDLHRDIQRESSTYGATEEKINGDGRLEEERLRADVAVKLERKKVDIAIDRERDFINSQENRVLAQERKQTDENLLVERMQTDTIIIRTSTQLTEEVEEHLKTKVTLTTRDEFLAIVSHDLRNPVGAISSYMEMLLEDSKENPMPSETKQWVEFVKRNADTSLRLISDILDMERIAEGKLGITLASHDISKIIKEAKESHVYTDTAKSILLHSGPSNISGNIICDRGRIMQVLSNLIGNALKFTPDGGSVVLKAAVTDSEVQFSVSDSGPGIPKEKREQIFERFAQLGSKDRSGLGLGLYISKMLVEAHHGKLWVESKVGEGSTFSFSIPHLL